MIILHELFIIFNELQYTLARMHTMHAHAYMHMHTHARMQTRTHTDTHLLRIIASVQFNDIHQDFLIQIYKIIFRTEM